MALPFDAGALKVTIAWALPAAAVTPVGAPGTALGVTPFEAPDGREFPAAFAAVAVNVYRVPLVSPVTV
jgi:hypothetical protein